MRGFVGEGAAVVDGVVSDGPATDSNAVEPTGSSGSSSGASAWSPAQIALLSGAAVVCAAAVALVARAVYVRAAGAAPLPAMRPASLAEYSVSGQMPTRPTRGVGGPRGTVYTDGGIVISTSD
jgi:hypothetical protein